MKPLGPAVMLAVLGMSTMGVAQERRPADTGEAGRLRRTIEQRFSQRVQQELNLTSEQVTKLRATEERFGERRRTLMRQQLERRTALREQMRPGVAANEDSVRKLLDGWQAARAELVRLEQEQDRELAGFLTPVQRARFSMMREQLLRRANEMREQRRGRMGPRGGARPERRPGARPRGGAI